jgi:hypothetical protein
MLIARLRVNSWLARGILRRLISFGQTRGEGRAGCPQPSASGSIVAEKQRGALPIDFRLCAARSYVGCVPFFERTKTKMKRWRDGAS